MDPQAPLPDDTELVRAAAAGDRTAFGTLVERHQDTVVAFVARFGGGWAAGAAEDIAQQAFLSAWQAIGQFEPRAKFLTWLLRIAANACLTHRRRQRLRRAAPLEAGAEPAAASGETPDSEVESLRRALSELPDRQRAALLLRHYHGMRYDEIAETLGLSVPAVETLLFRARQALRSRLSEPGRD